jgi:excinuclease ABC subunit C
VTLKEKVAKLPETPGVYFFKDSKGVTLYIGKARDLRARVSTYLHDGYGDERLRAMVAQAADVEVLETPSEVDALLLEARLVKETQPKFNIKLRDDKTFTMLAVTRFDDFPKVWVARETDEVNAEMYGPFTSAGDLREAVKVMQRIFKYATCRLEMRASDEKRKFFRPCLLYAINRCTAPCAARISTEDYAADLDAFRSFLRGDREALLAQLSDRMRAAAKRLDFERAAELRDQAKAIRALDTHGLEVDYVEGDITPMDPKEGLEELARVLPLARPPRVIEGVDIAHLQGAEAVGSLVSFVDGVPFKSGYRRFRVKVAEGGDDYGSIREVVKRRFARLKEEEQVLPEVLLIDGGPGQLRSASAALAEAGAAPSALLSLAKEEETLYRWSGSAAVVPLAKSSPALRLMMYVRDEAHRFAQHYHHVLRRTSQKR